MNKDFFEHHGIKGMKWGVRRKDPSGGSGNPHHPVASMSDKDLKSAVTRMNLEKQFHTLTAEANNRDKSTMQKGADLVGGMLATAGKQHMQQIITRQMGNVIGAAITRKPEPES
jgi:hypothetical protein